VKLFLAISGNSYGLRAINQAKYPYLLNSFAYDRLEHLEFEPKDMVIDSGAFTAWSSGKEVDIEKYGQHCIKWKSHFKNLRCVNLDVIPGSKGKSATLEEKEQAMKQSLKNADYLRSLGLDIEEVYHQDEPLEFLDLLLSRLPENGVLGLGSRKDVSVNERIKWLKQVLKHLVETRGKDNIPKTHGLGVSNQPMMLAFPFYSVDSSTYLNPVRFGAVIQHDGTGAKVNDVIGFKVRAIKEHSSPVTLMIAQMIEHFAKLEQQATTIWRKRGIVWED
jgi:hypothetical protein